MEILQKYAKLLVNYCLELKAGERLYINTSTLAAPLVKEVFIEATKVGAHVEIDLGIPGLDRAFLDHANEDQLKYIPTLQAKAMKEFDAYLAIRAPQNLRENQRADNTKSKKRSQNLISIQEDYFSRTADRRLKRCLCQYPTAASAQEAGMSLDEYAIFVYNACKLYEDDPQAAWLEVRKNQQKIVDLLNTKSTIRYYNQKTDISFSIKGRTWINSDGQTNMPSGEVFSAPVEDSVNGVVFFDYPSIYMGQEARDIKLWVENGVVVRWEAGMGQALLDKVFSVPGANIFGEVAIGTNYNIQEATKNILFDEKIGGTIHMAVGQSYIQAGGLNKSAIHWDMIADMKQGGKIYADGELIYENGKFVVFG